VGLIGVDRATVIITAPVPAVVDFLLRPRNLPRYLRGVPGSDRPIGASPIRRGRWAFAADPAQHRVRWWLLAPYRAAGTLDVYGDCSHSQLWLTVVQAPASMAPAEVHRAARTVLHRIRRCIEQDHARQTRRALLRIA
jgi:hypothetical protein